MNFMQAVQVMKEGKKVRRDITRTMNWRGYFEYKNGEIIYLNTPLSTDQILDLFNITDWEIVEEDWKLSDKEFLVLADRKCIKSIDGFEKEDIKTFIEKIKEDMVNNNQLSSLWEIKIIQKIIDKRAGDL